MKLKNMLALGLACTITMGLVGCSGGKETAETDLEMETIKSVEHASFEVPKELKDKATPYHKLMVSMYATDYDTVNEATLNLMDYRNLYQLADIEGKFSVAVYHPTSSLDLTSITADNAKSSIESLLREMSFVIDEETEENFGVDLSSEFYLNVNYEVKNQEYWTEDDGQHLLIPFTTSFPNQVLDEDGNMSVDMTLIRGYVSAITPEDSSTLLMLTYDETKRNDKDELETETDNLPLRYIAESLKYEPDNTGTSAVMDAKEVNSIETEGRELLDQIMAEALAEEGLTLGSDGHAEPMEPDDNAESTNNDVQSENSGTAQSERETKTDTSENSENINQAS